METATVVRLKSQLSRYLRRVKAGEEVIVTERGVPIARLVPVGKRTADLEDLRDLERQGLIRLGTGRLPRNFWKLPRPRDPKGRVLKALLEERESGR
jgi:prevent-host-death family protein